MYNIDARGISCPEPVLMTKAAVDENKYEEFTVTVDTNVAVENITRFAQGKGYNVTLEESGDVFNILIKK